MLYASDSSNLPPVLVWEIGGNLEVQLFSDPLGCSLPILTFKLNEARERSQSVEFSAVYSEDLEHLFLVTY